MELTNISDICTSHKPIIILAVNLLDTDPSFDGNSNYNKYVRQSLLPFLSNVLSWLTGTASSKDVNSIKKRVNQLTATQSTRQDAIVHIVSILKITRYAVHVKRQHINIIMDKVDGTVHDINNLYNLTASLSTSLSYYQLILHIRSVLANLRESLSYIRTASMHIMDYVNAATTGTLSPHILPIQDHSQQLSIYKTFTLNIPHGNFTPCYDINTPYHGITQAETIAVEILQHQFCICQEANRQYCNIHAPFQPLANPSYCITALYTKNTASISTRCSLQIRKTQNISMPSQIALNAWILTTAPSAVTTAITLICPGETMKFLTVKKPIHILQLPSTCGATSPNFHLPP